MFVYRKLAISLFCLVGLFIADAASGADAPCWPRFHGPRGDNISDDTGLLKTWPDAGPKLAWKADGIGYGYSSVTMADGTIYITGNIGDKTVITAMTMEGKKKWQAENGPAWANEQLKKGTRGSVTIDGERLFHQSPWGNIVCLSAKTGEKIWGLNSLKEFEGNLILWALGESLLVDGDHLICCPGGKNASVVAMDKRTGKVVWKAAGSGDDPCYGSSTLGEQQGMRMIFTMTSAALIGVNADNGGELLFRVPHFARYDVNTFKPIYHDGHVFTTSGYKGGSVKLKLTVDGDKVSVEEAWFSRDLDSHHGGVILLDGYLYGACHNFNSAKWVCLDWKTGEMKWAEKGVGKGSVTCAEGMLYTMSEQREIGLAKATPRSFELVGRFKIPEGGEGPTWAHAVVCGGRLYIRHGDLLYAYDVRAK